MAALQRGGRSVEWTPRACRDMSREGRFNCKKRLKPKHANGDLLHLDAASEQLLRLRSTSAVKRTTCQTKRHTANSARSHVSSLGLFCSVKRDILTSFDTLPDIFRRIVAGVRVRRSSRFSSLHSWNSLRRRAILVRPTTHSKRKSRFARGVFFSLHSGDTLFSLRSERPPRCARERY